MHALVQGNKTLDMQVFALEDAGCEKIYEADRPVDLIKQLCQFLLEESHRVEQIILLLSESKGFLKNDK